MADKEVPLPSEEKLDNSEKGEKEAVQSDESGQVTDTDKSSESLQRSTETSSGIELKFDPESSEREAISPELTTEVVSSAVSHSKSPFKSALKYITVGTSKILRKISPKRHDRRERSKSPERADNEKSETEKKLWRLSPKAQAEVEPHMKDEEVELLDESLSKSAREQDVDSGNIPKAKRGGERGGEKREVACKRIDSETSGDNITTTAKEKRDRFAHKLPDSAEIGIWTGVRLTVDTDWSLTTDQSIAESLDDFSDREVFTTTGHMSENLGLSEQEEKGFSEAASEKEQKNICDSPKKTPVKRQMTESSQEESDSPSMSKRATLQKDKSDESTD